MSKALPYFKWYPGDAETDENFRAMDDSEIGFYLRCLNHSWLNGGLPADPDERARVLRDKRGYADKQWKRVGRCFVADPNDSARLINRRQEEERAKAQTKSERATNSVRTRYERRENVVPRALTPTDSESVSESSGSEETKIPNRGLGDPLWPEFVDIAKREGVDGSEDDWNEAVRAWSRLDFEQKQLAVEGLYRNFIGKDNCLPVNYLRKKMWQRPDRNSTLPSTGESRATQLLRQRIREAENA